MAELDDGCCNPATQATCCQPEHKSGCCGDSDADGCGCEAARAAAPAGVEQVPETVPVPYAEAARVLRPGGRLAASGVIADPGMDDQTRRDMAARTGGTAGAGAERR